MYTKGIRAEQKSYGFKNLRKLGPLGWMPYLPTYLPTFPPTYLPTILTKLGWMPYLPTYIPTYLPNLPNCISRAVCSETNTSREHCAQKQIKSLGSSRWGDLYIFPSIIENSGFRVLDKTCLLWKPFWLHKKGFLQHILEIRTPQRLDPLEILFVSEHTALEMQVGK